MSAKLLSFLMAGWAVSCISLSLAQDSPPALVEYPAHVVAHAAAHTDAVRPYTASSARHNIYAGSIRGIVYEAETGLPLSGVHVQLRGTTRGAVTDLEGRFMIERVPAGRHDLDLHMLGFSKQSVSVDITAAGTSRLLTVQLHEAPLQLAGIVVKPEPEAPKHATVHGIQQIPAYQVNRAKTFDEDLYRTATRNPGVAANDFSSRFMIRGGSHDEVLVTFDGLELNDPFHLKDFGGGGISIVDADVIGEMALSTGGFTADLGDRMSGVFQLSSAASATQNQTTIGLSLMHARVFSQGRFNNGNTQWMVSGRRGYLDFLLDLMQTYPSYSPHFFDTFAKLSHRFGQKHTVALEGLVSGDQLKYLDVTDPNDQVHTHYGNGYVWLNWQSVWHARLYSETVISAGRIWRVRDGIDVRRDKLINFQTSDTRRFNVFQIKQDWTLEAADAWQTRWGFSVKQQRANYTYNNGQLIQHVALPGVSRKVTNQYAESNTATRPTGALINLYASQQVPLMASLTGTGGLRMGYASWTGDLYLDPRLNLQYKPGVNTLLRAGWGHFHQPQGIEQLYVEDTEQHFYPASRARHLVLGLDHALASTLAFKFDLYNKRYDQIRPRYVSPAGDIAAFFPEIDRYRTYWLPDDGTARGLEASLTKHSGRLLTGAIGYTYAQTFENLDGRRYYRDHDQRHAGMIDLNIQPGSKWLINLAWQIRSGWRYASAAFDVTYHASGDVLYDTHFGHRNAQRYPAYHKLDLRIARHFAAGQQAVAAFVEIQNVYNRQNVRRYRFEPVIQSDNSVVFERYAEAWLPRLPSFGLKWQINH